MKHPQIIKRISEGQLLPPFYGVAWVDYMSGSATCLPVPFNLLAAVLRGAWMFMLHGWRPMFRNPRDAYHQGLREGERRAADENRPTCWACSRPSLGGMQWIPGKDEGGS